jgi:hypothetical protein
LGWKEDVKELHKAITTLGNQTGDGLAELRRENAELRDLLGQVHADLARLRQEVEGVRDSTAGMRAELGDLRSRTAPAAPAGSVSTSSGSEEGEEREKLLGLAAGVARAEVVCHRDTWAFIVERASRGEHFRLPTDISEQPDGTVEVDVSGRSLIAVVDELWQVQREPGTSEGTRRMAARVYRQAGEALQEARQAPETDSGERRVVRIVIDDRPGPPST